MQNRYRREQLTCTQGTAGQKMFRNNICVANHPRSEADWKLAELRALRVTPDTFGIFSHEPLVEMKEGNNTDLS